MKKKMLIIIPMLILLALVIVFITRHIRLSVSDGKAATSISVIGGADGPTSVFIAGKIDASSDELEKFLSGDEDEVIIRLAD